MSVEAVRDQSGGRGTGAGIPRPTLPPGAEDDEDAPIRMAIEALVQSPENIEEGAGFLRCADLLLSEEVRKLAWNHYIYPLRELHKGGGPGTTSGLLLTGEPGTGKTALAKALAVEARVSFLPISNSNVLSQWAGKADRTMAAIFAVAKQCAPCIVFFDEAEKLLQSTASGSADAHSNVTNG